MQSWTESKGLSIEVVGSILMFAYEHQEYERDILFAGIAGAVEDARKQEVDHINRNYGYHEALQHIQQESVEIVNLLSPQVLSLFRLHMGYHKITLRH